MSTFSLVLLRKTERIEASPKGFHHKLTFEARFPSRETLTSHAGEQVSGGLVELVTNQPRFDQATLVFAKAFRDPDTGEEFPPSVSFYALIPESVFGALVKAPPTSKCSLSLSTDLMGAIRFNDSLGFEKVWNTEEQNPVRISYFEFSIQHEAGES